MKRRIGSGSLLGEGSNDWLEVDRIDSEKFDEQMSILMRTGSGAERDFYRAAWVARTWMKTDSLIPRRDESGVPHASYRQARLAACYAREDAAITVQLQLRILRRLDRNRNYLAVAIALLCVVIFYL